MRRLESWDHWSSRIGETLDTDSENAFLRTTGVAFVKHLLTDVLRRRVSPPSSENKFFRRNRENYVLSIADEQQRKVALQTMELVVISTNQVNWEPMRSTFRIDLGELSANHGDDTVVS